MPYDPYSRVFKPDMQASEQMPQWQQMGGSDQGDQIGQATGSFVDLLKKRMAGGKKPDGTLPYEGNGMPTGASGMASGSGGGGMSSL